MGYPLENCLDNKQTYSCSMLQWKSCFFVICKISSGRSFALFGTIPALALFRNGAVQNLHLKIVWIFVFYLTFRGGMDRFDYVASLESDAK